MVRLARNGVMVHGVEKCQPSHVPNSPSNDFTGACLHTFQMARAPGVGRNEQIGHFDDIADSTSG